MSAGWPDPQARERYIRFVELELEVMKSAAQGGPDPELLAGFDRLLNDWFPRTRAFIESRIDRDPAGGFSDEVRTVAWVEAHSVPASPEGSRVPGSWTEDEIAASINECFAGPAAGPGSEPSFNTWPRRLDIIRRGLRWCLLV